MLNTDKALHDMIRKSWIWGTINNIQVNCDNSQLTYTFVQYESRQLLGVCKVLIPCLGAIKDRKEN